MLVVVLWLLLVMAKSSRVKSCVWYLTVDNCDICKVSGQVSKVSSSNSATAQQQQQQKLTTTNCSSLTVHQQHHQLTTNSSIAPPHYQQQLSTSSAPPTAAQHQLISSNSSSAAAVSSAAAHQHQQYLSTSEGAGCSPYYTATSPWRKEDIWSILDNARSICSIHLHHVDHWVQLTPKWGTNLWRSVEITWICPLASFNEAWSSTAQRPGSLGVGITFIIRKKAH